MVDASIVEQIRSIGDRLDRAFPPCNLQLQARRPITGLTLPESLGVRGIRRGAPDHLAEEEFRSVMSEETHWVDGAGAQEGG